ncbi:NAD(P)-binding domain-containing protein [Micromonospora sp. M12]
MTEQTHQYLVVGAGPAGLQLSYYLQQAGADYVTLEREPGPGTFFRRYPRHRRLISLNKVHTTSTDPEIKLRWDWNSLLNHEPRLQFPQYSTEYFPQADDMVRYLTDFQRIHGLDVRYDTPVERIQRVDDGFLVRAGEQQWRARCLIVATGWGVPYVPAIRGIEHAAGYEDMDIAPESYAGKRVLIIGKGNSAFETASSIFPQAAMVHLPAGSRCDWPGTPNTPATSAGSTRRSWTATSSRPCTRCSTARSTRSARPTARTRWTSATPTPTARRTPWSTTRCSAAPASGWTPRCSTPDVSRRWCATGGCRAAPGLAVDHR